MKKNKPILLSTYLKDDDSGCRRRYGIFECLDCRCNFESRFERLSKMTGLCRVCANKLSGKTRTTHGHNNVNSRLYVIWSNMKRRCLNPVGKEVVLYAGVKLHQDWHNFEDFMGWMLSNGYTENSTIDRIDPLKGYDPDNCRLVDYSTQSANRRMTNKNKTGFIGVYFERGSWRSKVTWKGDQIHLGRFSCAEDAAKARDEYIINNSLPHTLSSGESQPKRNREELIAIAREFKLLAKESSK